MFNITVVVVVVLVTSSSGSGSSSSSSSSVRQSVSEVLIVSYCIVLAQTTTIDQ